MTTRKARRQARQVYQVLSVEEQCQLLSVLDAEERQRMELGVLLFGRRTAEHWVAVALERRAGSNPEKRP